MSASGLVIQHISFSGPHVTTVTLTFQAGLNLLYGASNTGKSFTLKTIDFMLGGSGPLPEFKEREGFDRIWFGFTLVGVGDFTLSRSIAGGGYELYETLISSDQPNARSKKLAAKQPTKELHSLSQYLLDQLGFAGKMLAKDINGNSEAISFRNIAAVSLVDETRIQNENSPIESGDILFRTKERSLFRLLTTGIDDSSITPVVDKKTFETSKAVRTEIVEEMVKSIDAQLIDYPDIDDLPMQNDRLTSTLEQLRSEFDATQISIRRLIEEKQFLSVEIPRVGQRIEDIKVHLVRFAQLDAVYGSDIDRLGALEEAGFLLSLDSGKPCALCGAPASAQVHTHDLTNIEQIRKAALVEVAKIERQREDLKKTVSDLQREAADWAQEYPDLGHRLDLLEQEIAKLAPYANENKHTLGEVMMARDRVKAGLSLLEQKKGLNSRLASFASLQKPKKDDRPNLKTPDSTVHELCKVVTRVLKAWEFPGECLVSFDEKSHDLLIDGKLRINNGKGVRAVTHAAFKVALLIFCREKGLPHPGFLVLDTPLLTYRDPMKNPKAGALTEDEKAVAKSSLKNRFFEHLSSIKHLGQFIVLENIDPPADIEKIAHVQTFFGNTGSGRYGLFPLESM